MSVLNFISVSAIPSVVMIIVVIGIVNRVDVFDSFTEGAKEGIATTVRIIPPLVGLMVAVGVFRASGALDLLIKAVAPVFNFIGIPSEILTLALIRPISGSAALAVVADIMKNFGPDSYIGLVACTIMGSTETIFYTLTVYFGSVGIKQIRYTLYTALIADVIGIIIAVYFWRLTA
ncbi:MAG: spore maturation protein [Deltaproteobacteria bacterium]